MKQLLPILIGVVILGLLFINRVTIEQEITNLIYKSACEPPISYSIGEVDPKFGITKSQVLKDAIEAEKIWENSSARDLFNYDPGSPFTINLVYDVRQKLNSQINDSNNNLKQEDQALQAQIKEYEKEVADFKQKLAALNSEIDDWNRKGGAPPDVYKSLIERQKALSAEADSLNEKARSLNQVTQDYNTQVGLLNQQVNTFNKVLNYKPEEGLYTQDSQGKRITIYFYTSKNDFVHTLAHEMGHALGMSHVNDPEAIMFPQTNDALTPSRSDLNDLTLACKKRNVIVYYLNRLINSYKQ